MSDQLTEISRKDLHLLKTLYTPGGTRNDQTYTVIDSYIRCFDQNPEHMNHIKFICLNGDFSHGTFLVLDHNTAYTDSLDITSGELLRLLLLIEFSNVYLFVCVSDGPASVIRDAFKLKNVELYSDDRFLAYHLSQEDAKKFTLQNSEGIELKSITKTSDMEKAYSVWPYRSRASFAFLQRAAKYNSNVGAYTMDGTLVSWAFRFMSGPMMALQTDEQFYGRGYGSLIVKALSKKIAELGHDVYAGVSENNAASNALFTKVGFKQIGHFNTICIKQVC